MAKLTTVLSWEREFEVKFEKEVKEGKVIQLRCKTCIEFEEKINSMKNFMREWIDGSTKG